ncbi:MULTISPECIES: DUF4214 domain-containing protein [unclassified Duganella]|uniref:DUF4214 domain-containing protein n=1 Tax=unclassified Duganella TaxID=2636909 RepID=UPI000E34D07A|nr:MULTISPECIES: DUF4214 domain-containing protein [unclassified Duganella]RFP07932.1 DUF4214 domain-containing protein [Duganella sp. BJB475]RFP21016.1 DUF4214 domain-containing protein [Duganella sp. BJB476]
MQRQLQWASLSLIAALLTACGGSNVDSTAPRTAGLRMGAVGPTAPPTVSAHAALVQALYLAYYGRVPDEGGMTFWTGVLDNLNLPATASAFYYAYDSDANVKSVLDGFGRSTEASDLYAGTNAEFVNTVYINLFGRYADGGSQNFWVGALDRQVITRSFAALAILVGAQGDDLSALAKKNDVATRFLAALTTAGVTDTSPKGVVGADLLAQVNANTDLAAFQAMIDAAVQSIQDMVPTSLLRYTAFQNVYGEIAIPVRYWLSYGRGAIPVPNGKLEFGLGERQIGFAKNFGSSSPAVSYDAPIVASSTVAGQGDGTSPTMLMLCQATTDAGTGAVSNKSTDLLVLNAAQMITTAKDLAGQTLSTYREDCGVVTAQNIVFDTEGAATVTDASGTKVYPVASVQAALNGVLAGGLTVRDLSWRAYRYTKADGSIKYAIVSRTMSHTSVPPETPTVTAAAGASATTAAGALSLWSQE